ncbi:MAG: hypothetical protein BWX73_01135 [Lentisphaerae bacterium ADurb.Bin082]|nr:MAG: hypothetical protein BWX73_01135 [Lentisphaerae bacterium ADurb.Bin082]
MTPDIRCPGCYGIVCTKPKNALFPPPQLPRKGLRHDDQDQGQGHACPD